MLTIKSGKQCSSAKKRIRDISELKQWMVDILLTVIDASRTSESRKRLRACVCTRDGLFSTCFNFLTISSRWTVVVITGSYKH